MRNLRSLINDRLVQQARLFALMTDRVRLHLPPEVAAHCWVGGFRESVLFVVTDSASFATLVHYQQHEILKRINSDFRSELPAPLTKLKAKLAKIAPQTIRPLSRPRLSLKSARGLACAAEGIADPELRSALNRLAQRGKSSS